DLDVPFAAVSVERQDVESSAVSFCPRHMIDSINVFRGPEVMQTSRLELHHEEFARQTEGAIAGFSLKVVSLDWRPLDPLEIALGDSHFRRLRYFDNEVPKVLEHWWFSGCLHSAQRGFVQRAVALQCTSND